MPTISAAQVKELRDATNVSMMECKNALMEAEGDMDHALRVLRERGMAVAAKKSSRTANQGLIAAQSADDGRIRALVEVNCETDFVARNPSFVEFVDQIAAQACTTDEPLGEILKDTIAAKVAELGENIVVRRNVRFVLAAPGAVASYIHLNSKVGVLVELGCEKPETTAAEPFENLRKDLTLHIAACAPQCLRAEEIPPETLQAEREIYAKQAEGKPAAVIEKIVEGKIKKYAAEVCLLDQGFVKEPKQSVTDLLAETGKAVGDTLTLRRFVRYQLGQ